MRQSGVWGCGARWTRARHGADGLIPMLVDAPASVAAELVQRRVSSSAVVPDDSAPREGLQLDIGLHRADIAAWTAHVGPTMAWWAALLPAGAIALAAVYAESWSARMGLVTVLTTYVALVGVSRGWSIPALSRPTAVRRGRLIFSAEGVEHRADGQAYAVHWDAVVRVSSVPGYAFLELGGTRAGIVPERAER